MVLDYEPKLWRIVIDNSYKYAEFVCKRALTNGQYGMTLSMHAWICPQIFQVGTFKFNEFIEKRYENARHMFNYIDQFVFLMLNTYKKSFLPHIRERSPSPARLDVFIDWVKQFKKELLNDTKRWSTFPAPKVYN